jgi:hypothetical protein
VKELFSAFSAAVFYPLVSLALPGLTAVLGWFLYFMDHAAFRTMVSQSHTETAFALMLMSIFVGTIIDDLGTRLESAWLDRCRNKRTNGTHEAEWWAYLRQPFDVEPSGRRHLRKLVARLKFELGVPIGLAFTAPALWLNPLASERGAIIATILCGILFAYLLLEAAATHEVLGELRHELLQEAAGQYRLTPRKPAQAERAFPFLGH